MDNKPAKYYSTNINTVMKKGRILIHELKAWNNTPTQGPNLEQ
jgi:hypothetical protein